MAATFPYLGMNMAYKDLAISAAPCGRNLMAHICSHALFRYISSTEQRVLFVESNWIAGNMLTW